MMMVLKRKEILVGVLIVLIGIAGYLNWNYTQEPQQLAQSVSAPQDTRAAEGDNEDEFGEHLPPPNETQARDVEETQHVSSSVTTESFFAQARMSRESSRSKAIEMLNQIINNPNADEDSKKQAQAQVMKLATITDKETIAENLIKAKGFDDAVVFVSDDTANVTVRTDGLSATDMARIQEIVTSQTGVSIKNIKIVEVK